MRRESPPAHCAGETKVVQRFAIISLDTAREYLPLPCVRGNLEALHLLRVLKQMQGFEIPANAWERQILARRIQTYDREALDDLCLTGAVGWGRLSPHPATLDTSATGTRRIVPTSVAPITFFVRDEADWMTSK